MAKCPVLLSKEVTIKNKLGLHARPAAMIANLAKTATSKVWIESDDGMVDATSVIDMLTMCCAEGAHVTVRVENQSDLDILESITRLVEDDFGE
ncbi:MAG: HPr family phosphocarrier protein [Desulfobacterales bacterium]